MSKVFILHHVHEFEEVKLIGVYSTRANAEAAMTAVGNQPGFRDLPEGFSIDEYRLDPTRREEGYVTAFPDGTFSD